MRTDDALGITLELQVGVGAARIVLSRPDGFFVFSYGRVELHSPNDDAGRAFVDEVAGWLSLELVEAVSDEAWQANTAGLEAQWVRLGNGTDAFGIEWETFKLFLSAGERHAEVFLRLSVPNAGHAVRVQCVEKWSEYRVPLTEILERNLSRLQPRVVQPRRETVVDPHGRILISLERTVEFPLPLGWIHASQPEGHLRLSDPDDEMMIELSYLHLPPLPPDAPDLSARMQAVIDGSERRASASPIATSARDGVQFAWSEYHFDSKDTKRPTAAKRPARGRWLLAANEWVQVLVTGCWWTVDADTAERAWDEVVLGLKLAARVMPKAITVADA